MAKVKDQITALLLHKDSASQDGWHKINSLNTEDIKSIKDPEGENNKKEITSIPSPFARIHLMEEAFTVITNRITENWKNAYGDSIHHKLVDHALDVGEVFFKYDIFEKNKEHKLELVQWNIKKGLTILKDGDKKHRLLGETLELYLDQDFMDRDGEYEFENIFLIRCNHQIIGGTSPTTLFFSGAKELRDINLKQGQNVFFDNVYYPLHKRTMDYQRYLFGLFKLYPILQKRMSFFWKYMQASLKCLEQEKKSDYNSLREFMRKIDKSEYKEEHFHDEFAEANTGSENEVIDIYSGIHHRKKKSESVDGTVSAFTIGSYDDASKVNQKYKGKKKPLVLQNRFKKKLYYLNGNWEPDIEVAPYNEDPLEKRLLPGQSEQYPYLTISDFLEPTLIKLVYPIDKENFFDGNPDGFFQGNKEKNNAPEPSYLLPIKPLYFEFFNTKDLQGKIKGNKPVFRMVKLGADGVRVELRIPIKEKGEYILFERIYKPDVEPSPEKNQGAIEECLFSMAFLPFGCNNNQVGQRVVLADGDVFGEALDLDYNLSFYNENSQAQIKPIQDTIRHDKHKHKSYVTTKFYVINQNYDYIIVSNGREQGIVVLAKKDIKAGLNQFTFAVDFGTTNSHVEYSIGGEPPVPFNITRDDKQLITLFDSYWDFVEFPILEEIFLQELIPYFIYEDGEKSSYRFPTRTVVTEIDTLQHFTNSFALGDINIPFFFGKRILQENTNYTTDLKWVKLSRDNIGSKNDKRVRSFIETLLILMRNKVVLNNGDVSNTKLIWFYPSSMSFNHRQLYTDMWEELFQKYFNSNYSPIAYSESEAPFYQYPANKVKNNTYPAVNIDIGGGTMDIIVFHKNQPLFSTSAKFAGNTIFGNGYADEYAKDNGFVRIFSPIVKKFLESNDKVLRDLYDVFQQFIKSNKSKSSDLMAFFFSIERSKEVREAKLDFSLSKYISSDEDFKVVFVVFFGAIIYHVAKLMKALDCKMPRNIALSGNGSKIINLLDPSKNLEVAEKFSKTIFEKVYGEKYHEDGLTMIQDDNPKEATCKGGIKKSKKSDAQEFDKVVLLGNEDDKLINEEEINYPSSRFKYNEIDDDLIDSVINEVQGFFDLLFDLDDFGYNRNFGIKVGNLAGYKEILNKDLSDSLKEGLNRRLELSDDVEDIAETLFFYPLVGSIHSLIQHIAGNE